MHVRVFRFLGSIQLAVPLLGIIVLILIGATFYESRVGSAIVQHEIYKSPWFGALMFLLAVNLAVSALTRYPWRGARKIGFALTHLGLIVIIAGSAAVIHLGTEGLIVLNKDFGPADRVRVEGEILEVLTPNGNRQRANLWIGPDGSVKPKNVSGLSLLGYSDNTIENISFKAGAANNNPAVKLSLHSNSMGQTIERWLAVAPTEYSKASIGPAELEILRVNDSKELDRFLSPPIAENTSRWGTLRASFSKENSLSIDIEKNLSKNIAVGDGNRIAIVNFWPDFSLDDNNRPINASEELNNPVIQLQVSTPAGTENWFLFGKIDIPPIRTLVSGKALEGVEINYESGKSSRAYFRVLLTPTGELYYSTKSSQGFKSGEFKVKESVSPGWADFEITLEEVVPDAELQRDFVAVQDSNLEGVPALLVKTTAGTTQWLPWGETTTIGEAGGDILTAFGPKLIRIPFTIALEDFIVDRNEGSDSVAMWTSKIRIEDARNETIVRRRVWMNHPTWYRGWKMSQASWDPNDLEKSTLQVKREPVWVTALTWTGSVLVILGIGIMFYGPAIIKNIRRQPKEESTSTETLPSADLESKELAPSN